jgi:hypothetical protein
VDRPAHQLGSGVPEPRGALQPPLPVISLCPRVSQEGPAAALMLPVPSACSRWTWVGSCCVSCLFHQALGLWLCRCSAVGEGLHHTTEYLD